MGCFKGKCSSPNNWQLWRQLPSDKVSSSLLSFNSWVTLEAQMIVYKEPDVSLLPWDVPEIERIGFLNLVECSSLSSSLPGLPGCSHNGKSLDQQPCLKERCSLLLGQLWQGWSSEQLEHYLLCPCRITEWLNMEQTFSRGYLLHSSCSKQGQLEQVAEVHIQQDFALFHCWRLYNQGHQTCPSVLSASH